MKRLHGALAIVAALLAAAAGAVDRGPIGQHRRNSIQTPEFISAPELAGRVIRGDRNLRVFDLRPPVAFEQFHVQAPVHVARGPGSMSRYARRTSLVLYGDGRATSIRCASRAPRQEPDETFDPEGRNFEWLGRVHEPRLAVDATPEERAEFERAAEMSRFFGGVPRCGCPARGSATGILDGQGQQRRAPGRGGDAAVAAIRRRGC